MSHDARRRLAVAGHLLHDPAIIDDNAWPRACTWLIRLALEHAIDDFWAAHRPEMVAASRRAQLLALTRTVNSHLGHHASQLWHTLSRAAHHHAYELAPTATELRAWHTEVDDITTNLEKRLVAAPAGAGSGAGR